MNLQVFRSPATIAAVFIAATAASLHAGVVRFTATINAAQEVPPTTSTATGTAEIWYDFSTNRIDLDITLTGFTETLTASHIHPGAPGATGSPILDLGAEANYTRTGDTLRGTFRNLPYPGVPTDFLRGETYLNFHTDSLPNGAIRGQVLPDLIKLSGIMTPEQEGGTVNSSAYGAVQATYNPLTNKVSTWVFVYNFPNTLSNSHIHEGAAGVSGGVKTDFGGAAVYTRVGNSYVGAFTEREWGTSGSPASPLSMVTESAYVNIHSNTFPNGEIRGQLFVTESTAAGRLVNVSSRGRVGTGDDRLITGFIVRGVEPVRVLVTARGPSLAQFGVAGVLGDPQFLIWDGANREIFSNNNVGTAPLVALLDATGLKPANAAESAAILVLPPGNYTSVVSGVADGTGVAISEAFEIAW